MPENKFEYRNLYNIGIWSSTLPNLNIQDLISKLYNLKNTSPPVDISNVGGYQTSNYIHLNSNFFSLVEIINKIGIEFSSNPNTKLINLWGNISSFGNYNMIHNHEVIDYNKISGIIYLQVPKNSGRIWFYNPININISIPYTPKEKDILIFPSILYHSVEPNLSKEDQNFNSI
jgi:hypothetical protein